MVDNCILFYPIQWFGFIILYHKGDLMKKLMRCLFCGLLQDEPHGVKTCQRCGGQLEFEDQPTRYAQGSYLDVQMELDQVNAPAGQTVDRHLLVSLRTPKKVPETFLAETESGRPPLSFNVVLDVSGSMGGVKIEHTKQALRMAARVLRDGDHLAMTVFSNEARVVFKPAPYNDQTRQKFESLVNELRPGGMTALFAGLDLGLHQGQAMQSENNLTLLLSDGEANVGETDLEIIGNLARRAVSHGLIVSTMGVGAAYNEAMMTEIATQGKGRFYHIQSTDEIVPLISSELGEAADVAARDVKIHIQLPKGAALIPLSALYQCEIKEGEAIVSVGDIPIDLDVEVPLRLTLFSGKKDKRLEITGAVTYQSPSEVDLKSILNRVTVRFIDQNQFEVEKGVVKPVATKIAEQMHAKQVLNFSRAFTRGDTQEIDKLEAERVRFRDYVQNLDEDTQKELLSDMDEDMHNLRSASPMSKNSVYQAYQTQRSMRNHKKR
jgi:Ca-activated chloride channel family protein